MKRVRAFATGQGLLETVVAIGVIMTGLVSVMALVVSNLNTEREAGVRYQAINIAREGIEIVRNRRDSNWLVDRTSWDGLTSGISREFETYIAFNPETTAEISALPTLFLPDSNGVCRTATGVRIQQGGGCEALDANPTFTRTITLTLLDCSEIEEFVSSCEQFAVQSGIAMNVVSTVDWEQGGNRHQIKLGQMLYDWK